MMQSCRDTPPLSFYRRGGVNLANIFVPAIQPGATLDWDIAKDAFANRHMTVRQDIAERAPATVTLTTPAGSTVAPIDISLSGPIDLDGSDWREDVQALAATCTAQGVPHAVEVSRSGDGAHLWIFFSNAVAARQARALGSALISETCRTT